MRPEKRAALAELRRRQHWEWAHLLTPDQRLQVTEELIKVAEALGRGPPFDSDEPPDLWLALKAKWRRLSQ